MKKRAVKLKPLGVKAEVEEVYVRGKGSFRQEKPKTRAKVTFVNRHSSLQQKTVKLEEIDMEYARKTIMEKSIIPNEGEGFFDTKTFT